MADAGRNVRNAARSIQRSKFYPGNWFSTDAGEGLTEFESLFDHAIARIARFLLLEMPIFLFCMMGLAGFTMSATAGWSFTHGFNLMATAAMGGALVLPTATAYTLKHKLVVSLMASFGVGIWGFMVAVLGNSLISPIVCVLGIEVKDSAVEKGRDSWTTIFRRLGFLAVSIVKINIILALTFGIILSYMQGWEFWEGFKTMASVVLGGGITFDDMKIVTSDGKILYVVVGVWSFGLSSLMVAIAGDPGHKLLCEALEIRPEDDDTWWKAGKVLAMVVLVVLPVTLLLIMVGVASIMAPFTSWEFQSAFWAALPATSGGAAQLSSEGNPHLQLAETLIFICAASAGFFILSCMMGVGGELSGPIMEGPILGRFLGKSRTVGHSVMALLCICAFLIPAVVAAGALCVGGLMALVTGWPFHEGFWWAVAVQLGGGVELCSKDLNSLSSMLVGVVGVAWSIGISIVSIGLSGAPVVVPLMDALGMTVHVGTLEKLEISCRARRPRSMRVFEANWGSYGSQAA